MATLTEQILALYTKGYAVKKIAQELSTPDKVVLPTTVSNTLQRVKHKIPKTKEQTKEILVKSAKQSIETFINSDEELVEYIDKSSRKTGALTVGIVQQVAEQLDSAIVLSRDEINTIQVKLKFLQVANQMFKQKE